MSKRRYRSGWEATVAKQLEDKGVKFLYEPYELEYFSPIYNGVCRECGSEEVDKVQTYLPDFVLPNGNVIEAKGRFVPEARTKMLNVIYCHPDITIHMLFQRDNYVTRKKGMTYSRWCQLKNVSYAIGEVPDEWL